MTDQRRIPTTIDDAELRARGVSEIDIDALDRYLPTQKNYGGNRDRAEVEKALKTRGVTIKSVA